MTQPDQPLGPDVLAAWQAALDLGEPAHTITEAADLAGIDVTTARRLWRGLGLPEPAVEDRHHTDEDVRALQRLSQLLQEPLDDLVHEIRFIALHLAAVAEAEVEYLLRRLQTDGGSQTLVSDVLQRGFADSHYAWLLLYTLRRQLDAAVGRRLASTAETRQVAAVGFIDIVGFTRLVSTATRQEVTDLLDLMERTSIEAAAASNARVVKFIGDEVMLVAPSSTAIIDVAQRIADALAAHDSSYSVHGGLATGQITPRGSDVVGVVANLAHRLATAAPPGTLLQAATEPGDDGDAAAVIELRDLGHVRARKHKLT